MRRLYRSRLSDFAQGHLEAEKLLSFHSLKGFKPHHQELKLLLSSLQALQSPAQRLILLNFLTVLHQLAQQQFLLSSLQMISLSAEGLLYPPVRIQ